jgi:hypothetical protein
MVSTESTTERSESTSIKIFSGLGNVHKYSVPIDIINFEIVINLPMLFVLMIVVVYQMDVAIVNMIVHMVKMNIGVHQMFTMNRLDIDSQSKV